MGGKKLQHHAVLSCDPSFKGCAFVLWYPAAGNYSQTEVYDIRCDRKRYDSFLIQVQLVKLLLLEVLKDFAPHIHEVTAFVIEGQFKPRMQCLLHAIVNQLYTMLPGIQKIYSVAPKTWRNHFKLSAPNSTYTQRKKDSVEYLRRNPQLICSELWSKDDNICEAVLLLNYILQKQRLSVLDTMPIRLWLGDDHKDFTDKQIKKDCPECGDGKGMSIRIAGSGQNKGKPYFHCKQCQTNSGKGHKGGINNKKWLSLIEAAQREANNYMLEDADSDGEEQVPAPKPKKAAAASRPTTTDADRVKELELTVALLKGRMDAMEKMMMAVVAPSREEQTDQVLGNKRRKLESTRSNTTYFSDMEKGRGENICYTQEYMNGDGDD